MKTRTLKSGGCSTRQGAPASEGGRYKRKKNPKSGPGKPGPYTGKSTGRNACVANRCFRLRGGARSRLGPGADIGNRGRLGIRGFSGIGPKRKSRQWAAWCFWRGQARKEERDGFCVDVECGAVMAAEFDFFAAHDERVNEREIQKEQDGGGPGVHGHCGAEGEDAAAEVEGIAGAGIGAGGGEDGLLVEIAGGAGANGEAEEADTGADQNGKRFGTRKEIKLRRRVSSRCGRANGRRNRAGSCGGSETGAGRRRKPARRRF